METQSWTIINYHYILNITIEGIHLYIMHCNIVVLPEDGSKEKNILYILI